MEELKCKLCGSKNIIKDFRTGEYYCSECGAVVEENIIDLSQEWRAFSNEQLERRARSRRIEVSEDIGTELGRHDVEVFKTPTEKRFQYLRLRKLQKHIQQYEKKFISVARIEIGNMLSILKLPSTLLNKIINIISSKKMNLRGKNKNAYFAALIYLVAKQEHIPIGLREISEKLRINKSEIFQHYKQISRQLGIRIMPADPIDFVERFASALNIKQKTKEKAYELIQKCKEKGIFGTAPAVAAACIFVASLMNKEKITIKDVSNATFVTTQTIKYTTNEIIKTLNLKIKLKSK